MASDKNKRNNKIWLTVGVVVLIALLIIWLTFAFMTGDTDVAASMNFAAFIDTFRA